MATNNSINAPLPISVANGGTGLATLTAHGVLVGEGTSNVNPIVLGAGQVLIGTTASDPSAATLTAGTNIGITSSSGSITINSTGTASFGWSTQSGTSATIAANTGYDVTAGTLCTLTLPATMTQYASFQAIADGAGGFKIAQGTGQQIRLGSTTTTLGATGSLQSTAQGDWIEVICTVANTTFVANVKQGNITVV